MPRAVITESYPVVFREDVKTGSPENFPNSYLLAYDFDETCFTTFISSGKGPEVHEAYEIAVQSVLGGTALRDFSGYGGLSNRAPLDVIQGLITTDPKLVSNALDHASEHFPEHQSGHDIGLELIRRFVDRRLITPDELTLRAITELLVIRKKEVLLPQINEEWPKPVSGFVEHWHELEEARRQREGWQGVHTAVVSSGHSDFISRTFEVAGLEPPDVLMTDDEMRKQIQPRTKPDPYALMLVEYAWLEAYGILLDKRSSTEFKAAVKPKQTNIGDDPAKDGEMAKRAGISFIHHDGQPDTWHSIGAMITSVIDQGESFAD